MTCKLADNVKWKISLRASLTRVFREPSFLQQATRVALSTKQSILEIKPATLHRTYRRANVSFTTMGRSLSDRSQWPCNSCWGWSWSRRMPPQPESETSEKTSNWECFSSLQVKNLDQESRKRQSSNSAFNSWETGIALGDLDALDIARQATRENNLATGTTSVKELILPTNFCSDFKDTVLWLGRSSLREANLIFFECSFDRVYDIPQKIGACVGIRVDFWRPMK